MSQEYWDCHAHVFGPIERFPVSERRGYMPPVRTLEQLEANGRRAGIGHVVLVQPSIYARISRVSWKRCPRAMEGIAQWQGSTPTSP